MDDMAIVGGAIIGAVVAGVIGAATTIFLVLGIVMQQGII